MHRQSLGSPNSKLHSHGGVVVPAKEDDLTVEEQKRKDQASTLAAGADDDEVRKSQKPQKSPEKFIHLIPMLIIFCFLILYLSSHDPSQKGTEINGHKLRISVFHNESHYILSYCFRFDSLQRLQADFQAYRYNADCIKNTLDVFNTSNTVFNFISLFYVYRNIVGD